MKLDDLTYIYHFSSDREIVLKVKREDGQLPRFLSSFFEFETLTDEETKEFHSWQHQIVDEIMDELTCEEILQVVKYGVSVVFGE